MSENKLVGEFRTSFGKGSARKSRAAGRTPAVIYGHGSEPRHITLPAHEIALVLRHKNAIIELDLNVKKETVLVKSASKDVVTQVIEHVDLVEIVREVGKGQVGLPELKRLALQLGRDVEYARLLYALAQLSSLVGVSDKRWKVGSAYQAWLAATPTDRWQQIASTWISLLGESTTFELSKSSNLSYAFQETFPIARDGVLSHITRLISFAELIGLSSSNYMSTWFRPLLEGNTAKAIQLLSENLPATQNRIIIQADLTIIAVGPLPTDKELELRRFVETERIGVASTYRINNLSVTYGLETGLTETDVRSLLMELSGVALPQPVDYLIREAATRFGRLVLRETANGTLIQSNEQILLTQILNDSALKTLGITKASETTLESRFEVEIVYYLLRESKYAAIRKDSKDQVVSSWLAAGSKEASHLQTSSVLEDIQKWRDHDKRLSEAPEGQDLVRQIEMAIKTKAAIRVSLQMNGTARDFLLEPTGLANGRLRGRDRQADCERVLPLASITGVRLGQKDVFWATNRSKR